MRIVEGEIYYKRNGSHHTICVKPSINQLKDVSPKCRIFQTDNWSAVLIKSFLWTYDTVGRGAHSKLSRKKVTDYNKKWYQHMAEKVPTSAEGNVLILRDVEIYERVKHSRLEITIKRRHARNWYFVDLLIPQDHSALKES